MIDKIDNGVKENNTSGIMNIAMKIHSQIFCFFIINKLNFYVNFYCDTLKNCIIYPNKKPHLHVDNFLQNFY
ncbi:MAG: hypothetical protein AAB340_03520 [Patescibacteria group bacterium]